MQICNECGDSVRWGSGRFINRIPDLNDERTRMANNKKFPKGNFLCAECDAKEAKP